MSNNNTTPHIAISMNDKNDDGGRSRSNSTSANTTDNRARSPNRNTSANRSPARRNQRDASPRAPLLDTEEFDPRAPPMAGPEIDDDTIDDDIPFTPDARPGVDDSFFPPQVQPQPQPRNRGTGNGLQPPRTDFDQQNPSFGGNNGGTLPRRGSVTPVFPYAPDFAPGAVLTGNDLTPREIPDVNVYQHKKTLAQGMMDLALLSANANQLRYVVESYQRHPYYYFSVVFISLSLILQIAVGVGLILNSRFNIKNEDDICKADKINNYTIIGIFLITVVNVFVSAFGVATPQLT